MLIVRKVSDNRAHICKQFGHVEYHIGNQLSFSKLYKPLRFPLPENFLIQNLSLFIHLFIRHYLAPPPYAGCGPSSSSPLYSARQLMSPCDSKNALIAVFLQDVLVYHPLPQKLPETTN